MQSIGNPQKLWKCSVLYLYHCYIHVHLSGLYPMISFVMNNNITVNLFHPMLYNNSNYSVCIPSYATIMCVLVRVCSISIVVITLCVFLPMVQ